MSNLRLILTLVAAFFCLAMADVPDTPCAEALTGGIHFQDLDRLRAAFVVKYHAQNLSNAELSHFWKGGWAYIRRLAVESEATVLDILNDNLDTLEILAGEYHLRPEEHQRVKVMVANFRTNVKLLELVPLDQTKFNKKTWDRIKAVLFGFTSLGSLTLEIESLTRHRPSFNPFAQFSGGTMEKFLDAVELVNLDNSAQLLARDFAVLMPPLESSADQVESVDRPPMSAPLPIMDPQMVVGAEVSSQLKMALQSDHPFRVDFPYRVTTVYGRELDVIFSSDVAELDGGATRDPLRRLVRSLVTGKGDKSGLKTLFDIGRGIVELKTKMHGHKRIIGCLKGQTLKLVQFIEVGTSRASYARRISPNLCL